MQRSLLRGNYTRLNLSSSFETPYYQVINSPYEMVLKGIQFLEKALCLNGVLAVHGPSSVHRGPGTGGRRLGSGENRPVCLSVE